MTKTLSALAAASVIWTAPALAQPADPLTRPIQPAYAARWLAPQAPARVFGNTYYVGFGGLSLALIDTGAGLMLVDGGVPQGVAQVEANIRKLGFRVQDIRYILSTESHWDHSSGIAALARGSGAMAIASASGAEALRLGRSDPEDPQAEDLERFPAVGRVRAVRDGETIRLGNATVRAVMTPGHSPGSTSWTWKSCEAGQCRNVVFAASLNPISSDHFHYTRHPRRGDLTTGFRAGMRKLAALPCDVLITAHPDHSGFDAKLKAAEAGRAPNPFVDPGACRAYSAKYEALLDKRIAGEKSEK
ncbi:subclass B3 metallo-beta-lactamase [Phenylobacterium deserti]|uniref:Subclass B3 metallo-beta-lactamase n=1 Tax=Phenylobacterium deserti TaxID=1914756 RepID=A0A328AQS3_9CAUL|nr:subclass B3 metallo-beta-lactamase [Phenylobacterium deserti]RAK57372.1 subclass B3 metallo-beta-lactamase [Phenylobacterium deserti]